MNTSNIFAGLGSVSVSRRSNNYFTDGTYLAEILDVKKRVSVNPSSLGEVSVIIELSIVDVLVDKGEFTTPAGDTRKSNPAGEVVCVFIKMKWAERALKMLKGFLCAAGEITASAANQIDDQTWLEYAEKSCFHLGDEVGGFDTKDWVEQPLSGKTIEVAAKTVLTKSNTDFTIVDFSIARD